MKYLNLLLTLPLAEYNEYSVFSDHASHIPFKKGSEVKELELW